MDEQFIFLIKPRLFLMSKSENCFSVQRKNSILHSEMNTRILKPKSINLFCLVGRKVGEHLHLRAIRALSESTIFFLLNLTH